MLCNFTSGRDGVIIGEQRTPVQVPLCPVQLWKHGHVVGSPHPIPIRMSSASFLQISILLQAYTNHAGVRDLGTKRWLEGKLNSYNTGLFTRPDTSSRIERPVTPRRNYIRYMPVDDAVDMYKKRCMTVGTLSKVRKTTWGDDSACL